MAFKGMFSKFRRSEDGVALVEFGIFLPLFLLAFFVIVEFSRLFFSFQGAVNGVRDAARYMARTVPGDICVTTSGAGYNDPATSTGYYYNIVRRNMDTEDDDLLPELVRLVHIDTLVSCETHAEADRYRQAAVPIAHVTARFEITFPLFGILEYNGQPVIETITRDVTDMSRIYGV